MPARWMFLLCLSPLGAIGASPEAARELAAWLSGAFSCAEQALRDSQYQNLQLHGAVIWPQREDGPWIYLEQALALDIDRPYRQRVYQLVKGPDGQWEARVFTLPRPLPFTGAWREPFRFDRLRPEELIAQPGCTLFLQRTDDGGFAGATRGEGCPGELRGAAYATTEIRLQGEEIYLWERGYAANGTQLWGPASGGYVFKRLQPPARSSAP